MNFSDPDDVFCAIELHARYDKDRTTASPASGMVSGVGGNSWNDTMPLDYSSIPELMRCVETLRAEAQAFLDKAREPGFTFSGKVLTEVWIGLPHQFEPRPSDAAKLWPRREMASPALCLSNDEISAQAIETALSSFDTADGRLRTAFAAAERRAALEQAAVEATILQAPVQVSKVLRFQPRR